MKMLSFKFVLAAAVAVGVGAVMAQEMGETAPEKAAVKTVATDKASVVAEKIGNASPKVEAEKKVIDIKERVPEDPGPKIVVESQQWKQQFQPSVAPDEKEREAVDVVQEALAQNGMRQGFISGSRAIIQVGVAQDTVKDATTSKTLMQLREGLAREAILNARVAIVRAIRQKMSQGEQIVESDSQEFDKYKEKHAEEFSELERQKEKVANLLKLMDSAEADSLEGRTLKDDWDAVVEGIIKRIDSEYDPDKVAADKKARYIELKEAYEVAKNKLAALKKAYESDPIGKNISDVKACFDLDLYGLCVLHQAESLSKDGTYQIACAAVWSPKLQERAILALSGKAPQVLAPGESTLEDWLQKKEQTGNLVWMVGTRQFVDDKGVQHLLGIAAREVPRNARQRQREQEKADLEAERLVLSALYEQTSGTKEKHDELLMYAGADNENVRETDALGTYAKNLVGKTPERPVSGLVRVHSARLVHPFSGKPVYISVYAIDNRLAAASEKLLDEITRNAVIDATNVKYIHGQDKARRDILDQAKRDDAARKKGEEDAWRRILPDHKKPVPENEPPARRRRYGVGTGDGKIDKGRYGVGTGDGKIDGNF